MSLRERCMEFIEADSTDVDDLVAFVTTEVGRAADHRLEEAIPVALYFRTVEDRLHFVTEILMAKPNMVSKRWPR